MIARRLGVAVSMLTKIPVPAGPLPDPAEIARSAQLFPVVGLIIGALMAAVYCLLAPVFSPLVAGTAAVAARFFITGGFHLDGLMDTADGMMSGADRERALRIMHDGPVGPMGASCGALTLILHVALTASAGQAGRMGGLVFAPAAARLGIVLASVMFPSATPGKGMGSMLARKVSWGQFLAALAYTAALGVWIVRVQSWASAAWSIVWSIACAIAVAAIVGWRISKRLGGVTGDVYGALCEIGELAALAVFAFRAVGAS